MLRRIGSTAMLCCIAPKARARTACPHLQSNPRSTKAPATSDISGYFTFYCFYACGWENWCDPEMSSVTSVDGLPKPNFRRPRTPGPRFCFLRRQPLPEHPSHTGRVTPRTYGPTADGVSPDTNDASTRGTKGVPHRCRSSSSVALEPRPARLCSIYPPHLIPPHTSRLRHLCHAAPTLLTV